MIAAAPDQMTTVAVGHGHVGAPSLTWQDVKAITEQYLHRTQTEDYARQILYQFKHLLPLFPASPHDMTPKHISTLGKLTTKEKKILFGNVALALIQCGVWSKQMLPQHTPREAIERVLAPEWRRFTASLEKTLTTRGAPRESRSYWIKWAGFFIWHSSFPPGKPLDAAEVRNKWTEFRVFIKPFSRRATGSMLDRAFATFWNHAIDAGLLKADRLKETLTSASFWSILQPEIRERIGTHHRGCGDIPPEDEWLYSLRYALCVLGFSVYAQERALAIAPEEIESVHERLKVEKFAPETIERLLGALHQLSVTPRGQ